MFACQGFATRVTPQTFTDISVTQRQSRGLNKKTGHQEPGLQARRGRLEVHGLRLPASELHSATAPARERGCFCQTRISQVNELSSLTETSRELFCSEDGKDKDKREMDTIQRRWMS